MQDRTTMLQEQLRKLRVQIDRLELALAEKPDYGLGKGDPAITRWEMDRALLEELKERASSLEQALQLHLKSKMLVSGIDYPRTHSVRAMMETLMELNSKERPAIGRLLDDYLLELGLLEDAYITSRYTLREFKKEEAERLMKAVEEVMRNV